MPSVTVLMRNQKSYIPLEITQRRINQWVFLLMATLSVTCWQKNSAEKAFEKKKSHKRFYWPSKRLKWIVVKLLYDCCQSKTETTLTPWLKKSQSGLHFLSEAEKTYFWKN